MVYNKVKEAIKNDQIAVGIMVSQIRTPALALIADTAGLNFLILDMEHGSYTYETVENICIACKELSVVPMLRIPEIRRECMLKPLEAGAQGILVPRVETKKEAELAVRYARYAPEGDRGLSTRRAHNSFTKTTQREHTEEANQNILLMVQIETVRGLNNIDSIVSTPGIDLGFIGPSDLSFSLKNNMKEYQESDLDEAIQAILMACNKYGVASGIHIYDPEAAKEWVKKGLQLISINTDVNALLASLASSVDRYRNQFGTEMM